MKKFMPLILLVGLMPFLSGCFAVLAGAGGTAFWQAGKVITEEVASMDSAVKAAEKAFNSQGISMTDKVVKNEVTQLRGRDEFNKKIAVDVFSKGEKNVRIEIRYGLGEETPARDLLHQIKRRL